MKCPRCNYERVEPFKFCPKCGTPAQVEESKIPQVTEEYSSDVVSEPQIQSQTVVEEEVKPEVAPQIQPFVRRIPYGLTENTYKERKEIKKLSRISGGAFLCLSLISGLVAYVVLYTLMAFGMSYEKVLNLFEDPFFQQYFQIVVSSFMFIVPFTLFFKCSKHKISQLIDFSLPKTKKWFPIVLMGIGFCAFANIANSIAAGFFEGLGINYEVDFGDNPKGVSGFILSVLATAVVPALVEEFACRGIVLGALKKYGEGFGILVSSILFGLIHSNFQQIPFAFLVGLILGFITIKSGSIWPAVLIHFFNNFTSVIFDYLFVDISVGTQNLIYTIYLSVCLLIGLFALLLLANDNEIFKFSKPNTEATEKQKYKWFFTTETIIFVAIICIVESLQYFV